MIAYCILASDFITIHLVVSTVCVVRTVVKFITGWRSGGNTAAGGVAHT